MKKTLLLFLGLLLASSSLFTTHAIILDQKMIDGNKYIDQKEEEIKQARKSGNKALVEQYKLLRDSAIVVNHINRYLYAPCPFDIRLFDVSKKYVDRIESERFRDFARDYGSMLRLYPTFTQQFYDLINNKAFTSAFERGVLRDHEANEILYAFRASKYFEYNTTRKDYDTVISIPYLDDIVDRILKLIDNMRYNLSPATIQEYRDERNAIATALRPNTIYFGDIKFDMVVVEGGSFQMGATEEQQYPNHDEKPVHKVVLSSYMIGKTEVTQQLWEAVMGNNPSKFKNDNSPVTDVSWNECLEFIDQLNSITGYNFRLPTEAEWEYAARGGIHSSGNQYCGAHNLETVAWYSENAGKNAGRKTGAHPVATKAPNELGIYDMSGNVSEWCYDWYGFYTTGVATNPKGPKKPTWHVYRGGSFIDTESPCRVTYRKCEDVDKGFNIGFRLAL